MSGSDMLEDLRRLLEDADPFAFPECRWALEEIERLRAERARAWMQDDDRRRDAQEVAFLECCPEPSGDASEHADEEHAAVLPILRCLQETGLVLITDANDVEHLSWVLSDYIERLSVAPARALANMERDRIFAEILGGRRDDVPSELVALVDGFCMETDEIVTLLREKLCAIQRAADAAHHDWPYERPDEVKGGELVRALFEKIAASKSVMPEEKSEG